MKDLHYFGCIGRQVGHHLQLPNGKCGWHARDLPKELLVGGSIDGVYTPSRPKQPGRTTAEHGIEGHARLTHRAGWSILAWHDYSVDRRGGSNAMLLAPGSYPAEVLLEAGWQRYPWLRERITYEIQVVETEGIELPPPAPHPRAADARWAELRQRLLADFGEEVSYLDRLAMAEAWASHIADLEEELSVLRQAASELER